MATTGLEGKVQDVSLQDNTGGAVKGQNTANSHTNGDGKGPATVNGHTSTAAGLIVEDGASENAAEDAAEELPVHACR